MKIRTAALSLSLVAVMGAAHAQQNVQVSLYNQYAPYYGLWTDTGIAVTNGEPININASSVWNLTGSAPQYGCSPDGFYDTNADFFFNDGLHASLVAYIGSDPFQGEWPGYQYGYPFPQNLNYWAVGTSGQFFSPTNGELWLGFNGGANSGVYYNNQGAATASVSLGFNTNACTDSALTLAAANVTSNSFSFTISGGVPLSVCSIYDSSDLKHWTLIDAVLLSTNGSFFASPSLLNQAGSRVNPIVGDTYQNYTGVPYRFYKVTDGQYISPTVGFVQLSIGSGTTNAPGTNSLIANQLNSARGNTLDGLFNPMPDGTYLPAGSSIIKWNGSSFDYYTWDGSSWGGNGSVTLNPGEAAFLANASANPLTVTFAGLVSEGTVTTAIPNGEIGLSSQLPLAGGMQTDLGYSPNSGDKVMFWTGSSYTSTTYSGFTHAWAPHEPQLQVGQGFFFTSKTNIDVWTQSYSSRHF